MKLFTILNKIFSFLELFSFMIKIIFVALFNLIPYSFCLLKLLYLAKLLSLNKNNLDSNEI